MPSVKVDGLDTWIVERRKDDRLLIKATWKLSKDGRTLTDFYREFEPDGSTLSMDYIYQRSGGGSTLLPASRLELPARECREEWIHQP